MVPENQDILENCAECDRELGTHYCAREVHTMQRLQRATLTDIENLLASVHLLIAQVRNRPEMKMPMILERDHSKGDS